MNLLNQIPNDIWGFVIRIGLTIVAFFITWILRLSMLRLLMRPIHSLAHRRDAEWDTHVASTIDQPVRYIAIAIWLLVSIRILALPPSLNTGLTSLARSLIILAIFVALFKAIDLFAVTRKRLLRVTGITMDGKLLPFVRTALKLMIISVAIIIIMQEWGYNASGIIAGLGLGGLAFSLAAQDTVGNLFGFSTILGDRPFVVDEFIITPDFAGIVETIGLRSTRIRKLDQSLVIVPNNVLTNAVIINWSRLTKRWIDLTFGVTYKTTPDEMETLLQRIEVMLAEREHVDPESIQVMFSDFGEGSLDMMVRCYVDLVDWYDWMKEKEAVQLAIMRVVASMGLNIAIPSRSIYIEHMPQPQQQVAHNQDILSDNK